MKLKALSRGFNPLLYLLTACLVSMLTGQADACIEYKKYDKTKAIEAARAYRSDRLKNVRFETHDLLDYAETLILLDSCLKIDRKLKNSLDNALDVLEEADKRQCQEEDQKRLHYLRGVWYQKQGNMWKEAVKEFEKASSIASSESTLQILSLYEWGRSLFQDNDSRKAISVFERVLDCQYTSLDENYLRFSIFDDYLVGDDALEKISECYENLDEKSKAEDTRRMICRFYPCSDKCPNDRECKK